MKPMKQVLHVLPQGMGWTGGIGTTLNNLGSSPLGNWVTFRMTTPDQVNATLKEWQADLLVIHRASSWRCLPQLLQWKLMRKPLVLVEHHYSSGFETEAVADPWRFRMLLRLTYGLVDRVVAISAAQQEWMQTQKLVLPQKVRLIRSSRQLDQFLSVPNQLPNQDPLVLGAYGRFTHQKGFDLLIKAIHQLPVGSVRLLLGGQGPDEDKLKGLSAGHPDIQFLGRIDRVPDYLSQCDAVVIPSRWEPWGNVCLEARAASRPVLVTAVDGLTEQVDGCGLSVAVANSQALAKGIKVLQETSPDQRQQWGDQGRRSAVAAWNTYVEEWQALLEEWP